MEGRRESARHRLTVREWRARYLVPAAYADPQDVRDRLDAALRTRLIAALGQRLPALLDEGDGVVCIRRLELDLAVDVADGVDALAARCAQALAAALERTLGRGDDASIVRFRSPAERLARFLADAAGGDAWGRWYYRPFEGLRALPTSTALRSALEADPALGLAALQTLDAAERDRVYATLTQGDADRLLGALGRNAAAGGAAQAMRAVLGIWPAHRAHDSDGLPRLALRLFVHAAAHARPDAALRAAARRVAERAARLAHDAPPGALTRSMQARHAHMPPGPEARGRDGAAISPTGIATDRSASRVETAYTPFGGGFLLLDALDAMPVEAFARGWPACHATPAAAVLRLLLLAAAHGAARARAVFADPLWRALLAVEPRIAWGDLAPWLREVGAGGRRRMEARLAEGSRGADAALHLHAVAVDAHPHLLLVDRAGRWRGLAAVPAHAPDALPGAIRRAMRRQPRGTAIHVPARHAQGVAASTRCRAIRTGDADGEAAAWAADLEFLLDPGIGPTPAWQRLLALAAQQLLRAFAGRLPGFAGSHLAYLHANFLNMAAAVDTGPERRLVRLGRAPLALMLNLAGLSRGRRALHWIDGPALELFTGD